MAVKNKNNKSKEAKRESGLPGGGKGKRVNEAGSDVYPLSGPHPSTDAPISVEKELGQREWGTAGYDASGGGELNISQANPELCRDIMTKNPACCAKTDTVHHAAQLMRDQDIGAVAIVEDGESQKLIGILTDRDISVRVLADGRDLKTTRIGDVMTRDLVTCSPEDSINVCLNAMETHQVRRMPVVNDANRIVGIISQADIAIRLREPQKTAEVVEQISRPSSLR